MVEAMKLHLEEKMKSVQNNASYTAYASELKKKEDVVKQKRVVYEKAKDDALAAMKASDDGKIPNKEQINLEAAELDAAMAEKAIVEFNSTDIENHKIAEDISTA